MACAFSTFDLLALPVELRLYIYSFIITDRRARVGILSCSNQIYGEVIDVLYKDRDLVFETHPTVLADPNADKKRFVSVSLQHNTRPAIQLPPLALPYPTDYSLWFRRHGPYLPADKLRRIIIHIHEPPKDDPGQIVVTWLCINMISLVLYRLDKTKNELLQGNIDIVAHPLQPESRKFATRHKWLKLSWSTVPKEHAWTVGTGDISFALSTFWFNSRLRLNIHTTEAVADVLQDRSFWRPLTRVEKKSHDRAWRRYFTLAGDYPPLTRVDAQSLLAGGVVVQYQATPWPGIQHKCKRDVLESCLCLGLHARDQALHSVYWGLQKCRGKTADYRRANSQFFHFLTPYAWTKFYDTTDSEDL